MLTISKWAEDNSIITVETNVIYAVASKKRT